MGRFSKVVGESSLASNPLYSQAIRSLFANNFSQAESSLLSLKQQAQDVQSQKDILELLGQVYSSSENWAKLLANQEETFFTYLSSGTIYNDETQAQLLQLMRSYCMHDVQRGHGFMNFVLELFEERIPLAYQKECLVYGATLETLRRDYALGREHYQKSEQLELRGELLGMQLNNWTICRELDIEREMREKDYRRFCDECIRQLIDALISFEMSVEMKLDGEKRQLVALYQLIDQTENKIDGKTVNKIIDDITLLNSNSQKVIINLIDVLINIQQQDKALAWIKVIFKNKASALQEPSVAFGRSLLQFAKIHQLNSNFLMSEKVLLDFLESNPNRVSFLQLLALTQYTHLLRQEQRSYEADEYEKQALRISGLLNPNAHILEQLIIL